MDECPRCGYLDDPHWRPRIFDFEVDFCPLGDLEAFNADLAKQLRENKPGWTITIGRYVYKRTKSNYAWRMWKPLYDVRGWNPKFYYDSAGTKSTAQYKNRVKLRAWVNVKQIVRSRDREAQQLLVKELH
jgi:hypothetical protein